MHSNIGLRDQAETKGPKAILMSASLIKPAQVHCLTKIHSAIKEEDDEFEQTLSDINNLSLEDSLKLCEMLNSVAARFSEVQKRLTFNWNLMALGGSNERFEPMSSVEMYNSRLDIWVEMPEMYEKRCKHGVARIDNSIYVVGGLNDGPMDSVEKYDLEKNVWSKVASMTYGRYSASIVPFGGKIYAIGGVTKDGITDKVERYEPTSDTWTRCAPLRCRLGRCRAGAVVYDGYIYLMGGDTIHVGWPDYSAEISESVERYDPGRDEWIEVAPMRIARESLGCIVHVGEILVFGGLNYCDGVMNSVERYEPRTNTWTESAPLSCKLTGMAVASIEGAICLVGGERGQEMEGGEQTVEVINDVYVYDPDGGIIFEIRSMNIRRTKFALVTYQSPHR